MCAESSVYHVWKQGPHDLKQGPMCAIGCQDAGARRSRRDVIAEDPIEIPLSLFIGLKAVS